MDRTINKFYILCVAAFVVSGQVYALFSDRVLFVGAISPTSAYIFDAMPDAQITMRAADLPRLFLQPQNPLVWVLLFVLWGLLVLDIFTQINATRTPADDREAIPLYIALLAGALCPWLFEISIALAALCALLMVTAAIAAARRVVNDRRTAVYFFAGWSTALGVVAAVGLIGGQLNLSIIQAAILVLIVGMIVGIFTQFQLQNRISYSIAVIWVFCGLALATTSASLLVALIAILAISGMAITMIFAAS